MREMTLHKFKWSEGEGVSAVPLNSAQISQIEQLISAKLAPGDSVLGGRSRVRRGQVEGLGNLVIKQYTRGGLLSKLISRDYLNIGEPRSLTELNFLQMAESIGCSVPRGVVALWTGGFTYRAWLVTMEVPGTITLAELSQRDKFAARKSTELLVEQIRLLVEKRILHIDLHPGNVLVDPDLRPYILDFDKARLVNVSQEQLLDQYLRRWRRSVIKHELPDVLSEIMCLGLRSYRNM